MINEELKLILSASNNTAAAFNGLNKNLDDLKNNAIKIGAAIAGALALRSAIDATEQWAEGIKKVQNATGLAATQASRMASAGMAAGLSADELALSMDRLSKNMFSTSVEADKGKDAFAKWGLSIRDTHGNVRNINDLLGDVADKVKGLGNGAAATALEMDLFGRSGAQLHDFLMQGAGGMEAAAKAGDALGLTLSQANMDDFVRQSRQMDMAMLGLKVTLGVAILPILQIVVETLTKLAMWFRDNIIHTRVFAGLVKVLGEAFRVVSGFIKEMLTRLGGLLETLGGAQVLLMGIGGPLVILALMAVLEKLLAIGRAAIIPLSFVLVGMAVAEVVATIQMVTDHWEAWRRAVHDGSLENKGDIEDVGRTTIRRLVEWGDAFSAFGTVVNATWSAIVAGVGKMFSDLGATVHHLLFDLVVSLDQIILKINEIAHSNIPTVNLGGGSTPSGAGVGEGNFINPGRKAELDKFGASTFPGVTIFTPGGQTFSAVPTGGGAFDLLSPFASGGIVTRPTRALLGESGPEAVIPLKSGGMGNTINVYVSGNIATSEQELAERIAEHVGNVIVRATLANRNLAY